MNMVSGQTRPAFELMRQLSAMGHEVRIISTLIADPKRCEVNASMIRQHGLDEGCIFYRYGTRELAYRAEAREYIEEHLAWCDVFHTFSMLTGSMVARISRRRLHRPTICTLASNYGYRWSDLRLLGLRTGYLTIAKQGREFISFAPNILYRRLLAPFQLVHSWSRYMASKAVRWGVSADRVVTTPIGVDLTRFEGKTGPDFQGHPVFLYLGWVSELRGATQLIRAFRSLRKTLPDAKLVIASNGFSGIEYTAIARLYGLEGDPSIVLTGFSSDVGDLISSSDAVVLPFRTAVGYVQPPLVVLESMACGKPVISTNIASVPELVTHEQTGLLVEPGDVRGLSAAMERVTDDSLAQAIGGRAKKMVYTEHSWPNAAAHLVNLYERLASGFSSHTPAAS